MIKKRHNLRKRAVNRPEKTPIKNNEAVMTKQPTNRCHDTLRIKHSLGIACCRLNGTRPEALFVCKRYTYAYNMFVHAKYNSSDNAALIALFNGMTMEEKLNIMSLNFTQIWYHVWLNMTRNAAYYVAKNKFETTFLSDGGSRLRKLIGKSINANRIWEIPKGRKYNKAEPDLQCAIREFAEETGITKKSYQVFPWAHNTYSYVDNGTKYINTYYIGFTHNNIEPRINFGAQDQISEICDIRWMSIDEIRFIDDTGRLQKFVRPIFNFIKKYMK